MHSFTPQFTFTNPPFDDPDEMMQGDLEFVRRLEAAQAASKRGLMAALAGGDTL